MDCKKCPDRTFCYSAPNTWTVANRKETGEILLRILRCRSGVYQR